MAVVLFAVSSFVFRTDFYTRTFVSQLTSVCDIARNNWILFSTMLSFKSAVRNCNGLARVSKLQCYVRLKVTRRNQV